MYWLRDCYCVQIQRKVSNKKWSCRRESVIKGLRFSSDGVCSLHSALSISSQITTIHYHIKSTQEVKLRVKWEELFSSLFLYYSYYTRKAFLFYFFPNEVVQSRQVSEIHFSSTSDMHPFVAFKDIYVS
jgi:hypothetical protein